MSGQNQKFNWQTAFGAFIISCGVFGVMESSAEAAPWNTQNSSTIAQVGVRSRIASPTPLNLRPQTHIPLPTTSRSRDYDGYQRRRAYDRYGVYRDRHNYCRKRCSRNDTVIIINPSHYSEFEYRNNDSYIRIIRQ